MNLFLLIPRLEFQNQSFPRQNTSLPPVPNTVHSHIFMSLLLSVLWEIGINNWTASPSELSEKGRQASKQTIYWDQACPLKLAL